MANESDTDKEVLINLHGLETFKEYADNYYVPNAKLDDVVKDAVDKELASSGFTELYMHCIYYNYGSGTVPCVYFTIITDSSRKSDIYDFLYDNGFTAKNNAYPVSGYVKVGSNYYPVIAMYANTAGYLDGIYYIYVTDSGTNTVNSVNEMLDYDTYNDIVIPLIKQKTSGGADSDTAGEPAW